MFGLILLNPAMTFFAIPISYEIALAMALALSAEIMFSKFLVMVRTIGLAKYLKNLLK